MVECWAGVFDIAGYLLAHFSEDDIRRILSAPKPDCITRILDTISNTSSPREK